MKTKETILAKKGNVIIKQVIGDKAGYWVYVKDGESRYYPMSRFHNKSQAIKLLKQLTNEKKK